jgi:nucleoid-associated protein YgaU
MRKPAAVKTTSAAPAKRAATAAAKPATKPVVKAAVKPAAKTPALKKAAVAKPAPAAARAKPAVKAAAPAKAVKKAAPAPKAARKAATAKPPQAAAEAVREKSHKARLVRDSFTMPEHEYELLGQVKKACLKAGFEIKKSELLRIGVALIGQLDLATLQNVLASLPQLKTGRPKKI